jgi:hypothetical protein
LRISVTKTGWFDGHVEAVADVDTTDSSQLDANKARQIEQIVNESGFFSLPNLVGETIGADLAKYEVTIEKDGQQHTVAFAADDESPPTAPVRRLVAALAGSAGE